MVRREAKTERLLLIRERRFLLGLMLIAGLLAVWLTRHYLAWAMLGLLFGYVCLPVQRKLVVWGWKPVLAAATVMTLVVLAIAVPIGFLIYSLIADVTALAAEITQTGLPAYIYNGLIKVMPAEFADTLAKELGERIPQFFLDLIPEAVVWIVDASVGIFILASALFAVLLKSKELETWLHRVIPLRPDREAAFFHEFQRALDAVIYGIVVVAAIQAVFGGTLWWLTGLPSPLFWTAVMFVFSMIPALGPSFVLLPGAVYAFVTGNTTAAVVLIIGTFIGIGIIDYVVRPWIIQKKGELEPTMTLLSIVGGVTTMGIIGIFVGPLVVAVLLHVTELTMATHSEFGGDYDQELFEPDDPIVGEPTDASAETSRGNEPA